MPSDETRDRVIEIIIVAQMSVILMAVMFYYFVRLPQLANQSECQAQSSLAPAQALEKI